jgi:chromosome segregation ATPase
MTNRAKRMTEGSRALELASSIATLNANHSNLKDSISGLTGEVRAGNQQNGQILSQLAVLASKQEDNNRYQESCDKDRDDIRKEFNAKVDALDERISSNTTAISRMNGRTAGLAVAISTAISIAAVWAELLHR